MRSLFPTNFHVNLVTPCNQKYQLIKPSKSTTNQLNYIFISLRKARKCRFNSKKSFKYCLKLEYRCRKIPLALFILVIKSTYSVVLECVYTNEAYYGNLGEFLFEKSYTCRATISTKCSKVPDEVKGVSRNHILGKNRHDVKMVIASSQNIKKIPDGIGIHFPNLEVVRFPYCQVSDVTSLDLQQFPSMRSFYLGFNKLKFVPGNLFYYNDHMNFVGLEGNQIKIVGKQFFLFLRSLTMIYMTNNPCTERTNLHPTNIRGWKNSIAEFCFTPHKLPSPYDEDEEDSRRQGKNTIGKKKKFKININKFGKNKKIGDLESSKSDGLSPQCKKTFEEVGVDSDDDEDLPIDTEIENTSETSEEREKGFIIFKSTEFPSQNLWPMPIPMPMPNPPKKSSKKKPKKTEEYNDY